MHPRDVPSADWAASRATSAAVATAWRGSPEWSALVDRFDAVAASDLSVARDRALDLMADGGWAGRLIAPLAAALAADPLSEPPLRVSRERGRIGVLLLDCPAARVTASVLSARALAAHPSSSVIAPGHVGITRYVRAGAMRIRRWRIDDDRATEVAALHPGDGDVVMYDGRCEGQILTEATGDVVALTAILRADMAPVVREYRIDDGRPLRIASTDDGGSRGAILLTLLRVLGRTDAAPVFDAATHDRAPHARWSAMREWLALDALAALPRLGDMASSDADAEVRDTARATLDMVERRRTACPA